MELIEITPEGAPESIREKLPEIARSVISATADVYRRGGYAPPWVGYLGVEEGVCAGTCGFKSAPVKGRVEIAYFTFPGNEGRGVATRMAEALIEIASQEAPRIRVCAQTLPERNASTRILEKLGFRRTGELQHPEDGLVWEWEWTGTTP
ncbi:MAG: GNAT family N-acetyltransferase [Akkermansiaceae bacterium]|nr:GNAT family N-acetyltransferase [Akkermansiaceae bacterium]NNM30647.1 GNAT family N-acetyltransferase [Akkermansiaceae bacterium]